MLSLSVAAQQNITDVIVAPVQQIERADRTEALGTLRSNEAVVITTTVTETVAAIHFQDGQRVQRGDVLVELTNAEERAVLAELRARLDEAKRQYDRIVSLNATGSASTALLDERQRDLETARAALVGIESRLADRIIRAPFAGVIGLRDVSPGALVEPGDIIATLDDDGVMKLDFVIPSLFLSSVHPGLAIEARTRVWPEHVFHGVVTAIDSRIDRQTRSIRVRAQLDNREHVLRPGLLMEIELLRRPRKAFVIPEEALQSLGDQHIVWVVIEQPQPHVEKRVITIGTREPGNVEVLSGLSASDQVVTHGQERLVPDALIRVKAVDHGQRALSELLSPTP
jgi:membrane fusion protein (multidrug efflux system)